MPLSSRTVSRNGQHLGGLVGVSLHAGRGALTRFCKWVLYTLAACFETNENPSIPTFDKWNKTFSFTSCRQLPRENSQAGAPARDWTPQDPGITESAGRAGGRTEWPGAVWEHAQTGPPPSRRKKPSRGYFWLEEEIILKLYTV